MVNMLRSVKVIFLLLFLIPEVSMAQAPRKINMGTNIAGINSETREVPFVDIMKYARPWYTRNIVWLEGTTWNSGLTDSIHYDEVGYPLEIPQHVHGADTTQMVFTGWYGIDAFPEGEYTLLWEGDGDFNLVGELSIVSSEPNRMVVDVQRNTEGTGLIEIQILRSNPEDHVRNIRFIMPGYEDSYQDQIFNNQWIDKLEPFSTIRFMDWGETNNWGLDNAWDVFPEQGGDTVRVGWNERAEPDHFTYNTNKGVPYEVMIQFANETGKDIWINVPHSAGDDYIRQMATLFKNDLDPELTIYVEYSNEIWNWMFGQTQWIYTWFCDEVTNTWPECNVPFIQNTMDIFTEVFAGEMDRIVRVVGVQGGYFDVANRVVMNMSPGSFDAVSPTAYFGLPGDADARFDTMGTVVTPQDIYDEVVVSRARDELTGLRMIKELIADSLNIPMIYYEGGQHLTPHPFGEEPTYAQALLDIQRDPLMYQLYSSWFDSLETLVDDGKQSLFMNFSFIAPRTARYGSWGILEAIDQDTSVIPAPKYQAIMDYLNKTVSTSMSESVSLVEEFRLFQNYPNPFNPETTIKYQLPDASEVHLVVFDLLGREVSRLVNEVQNAGIHTRTFDARGLSSGIYWYRLTVNGRAVQSRKMILLK